MPDKFTFYTTEQISEHMAETPDGYLVCCDVPVTRTGEFIYKKGEVPVEAADDGIIRILREEDEVFSETSLTSLNGKSITINHPKDFVGPENWQNLTHGTVQNVRRGEGPQKDLMLADLLLTTEEAIRLVRAGVRELSCGYDAEYETISKGYGRQRNITMNHLAIVDKGRAGSKCKINDSVSCTGCGKCSCNKNMNDEEDEMDLKAKMKKIRMWVDSFPFADSEEETEEEKKKREEKETADKKARDRGFKDAEEESDFDEFKKKKAEDRKSKDAEGNPEKEEKEEKEPKPEGSQDRKAKDCEVDLGEVMDKKSKDRKWKDDEGDISSRLDRVLALLEDLLGQEETGDKKSKDEGKEVDLGEVKDEEETEEEKEARLAKEKEAKDVEGEEEKEKEEKETKETADCEANWPEVAHRAEILFPGMNLRKPTKDHAMMLRAIKIGALKGASLREDTKKAVQTFTHGKSFDACPDGTIDAMFIGASELIAATNNTKIQSRQLPKSTFKTVDGGNVSKMVASINQRNKEFYKQGNQ